MFPAGAAVVGPVTPDMEYVSNEDKARGKQPKQKIDEWDEDLVEAIRQSLPLATDFAKVADADGRLVLFAGSLREYPGEKVHR